jgi:hypothetical protein
VAGPKQLDTHSYDDRTRSRQTRLRHRGYASLIGAAANRIALPRAAYPLRFGRSRVLSSRTAGALAVRQQQDSVQRGKPERSPRPRGSKSHSTTTVLILSALVAINRGRIKPFHEKHRIDDLIGRIAIKIGLHRPTGFSPQ